MRGCAARPGWALSLGTRRRAVVPKGVVGAFVPDLRGSTRLRLRAPRSGFHLSVASA